MRPGCDTMKCRYDCKDLSNEVRQQIFDNHYAEGADENSQVRIDDKNICYSSNST